MNKPSVTMPATALACALLFGCQIQRDPPDTAQIETIGMRALQQADAAAERKLMAWARQDMPVAQRELALLYKTRPAQRAEALQWFERAARGGDVEAAFQLGELLRLGVAGVAAQPAAAAPWYKLAAQQRHARAALVLGQLYKNGDGVARDDPLAARWLAAASEGGNAHAMFLLSYFYRDGRGVARDPARARALLEQAAEHEYPPALQELAMAVQLGDAHSARDERRAGHLFKEATEHRHNNWNRF
ncbi:hypothetical protein SAMN05428959_1011365 [Duganella sp. CF517]|uniref:tetratricopeptide repeat protein n=1 Tax=Duganella sp. CF517 TaxID=1881038 RepID=UPI0008AE1BAA|nr:tetratricopeptide repeat protein [Duganella sp. CF517]SEN36266.1 hypothetical protein SAMN05428959_1011365 [Duganella sp. CF517]